MGGRSRNHLNPHTIRGLLHEVLKKIRGHTKKVRKTNPQSRDKIINRIGLKDDPDVGMR